jgi:hypothetical protein
VNHALANQLFKPGNFKVHTSYKTITVQEYLLYARTLFRTARRIFSTNEMRHYMARELTNTEKAIFGDLKLLLGYRHTGYCTDARVDNHWWLRPLHPAAIQLTTSLPPADLLE